MSWNGSPDTHMTVVNRTVRHSDTLDLLIILTDLLIFITLNILTYFSQCVNNKRDKNGTSPRHTKMARPHVIPEAPGFDLLKAAVHRDCFIHGDITFSDTECRYSELNRERIKDAEHLR